MAPYDLAIFPLPIVLLPGVPELLHIFEPRYRRLLADCESGAIQFGIVHSPKEGAAEPPQVGTIGCEAGIENVWPLADGRSNVLVRGGERYVVREYRETDRPYLVASVEPYDDYEWLPDPPEDLVRAVHDSFVRFARAVNVLRDDPSAAVSAPNEPSDLSFHVSAALDLDPAVKQEFLRSQSALERLEQLRELLAPLNEEATRRVVIHQRSKRNGKGLSGLTAGDDERS